MPEPKVVAGAWLKALEADPAADLPHAPALTLDEHARALGAALGAEVGVADVAAALALLKAKALVKTDPKLFLGDEAKDPRSTLRICLTPIGREAARKLR